MRIVVDDEPTRQRVDRRVVAGAAFFVAMITIIAFPGVIGRNSVGAPVVGTVDGPPAEGQCRALIDVPDKLTTMVDVVPTVDCSEPHSGEIILLGALTGTAYPLAPDGDPTRLDRAARQCSDVANRYVNGVRPNAPNSRVKPLARARVTLPSPVQWAWGQRWFSCQVMPTADAYPISWTGTARLAALKKPPAPFASCADSVRGEPVSCQKPHVAEQLTWNDRSPTGDGNGCYALAAVIMKTRDPTYGGVLTITGKHAQFWTECWISTSNGEKLTGTVIGHGSGPLPLA